MEDETTTLEQAAPAAEGLPPFTPNAVPCTIHLINGKKFIVDDVEGWGYVEGGAVFAGGHFSGYSGHQDLLIPGPRIDYFELDFERLNKYLKANAPDA